MNSRDALLMILGGGITMVFAIVLRNLYWWHARWQAKFVIGIGMVLAPIEGIAVFSACRVDPAWTVSQALGMATFACVAIIGVCVAVASSVSDSGK